MKLKFVFFPFLCLSIVCITCYWLFFWLLKIEWNIFSFQNDFGFFLPFFLSILVVMLFTPYSNLLEYKESKASTLLFFFMVFTLFIPMITGQNYLETTLGKITSLDKISEVNQCPPSKYYTAKQYYIDKLDISYQYYTSITGKRNQYYNIDFFITAPIIDFETYFKVNPPNIFLGIRHHKQLNNKLSDEEKRIQGTEFINQCLIDFKGRDLHQFIYLERVEGKALKALQNTVAMKISNPQQNYHFFYAVNEPFDQRTGNSLSTMLWCFGIGITLVFFMIRVAGINPQYHKNIAKEKFNYFQQLKTTTFLLFSFKDWFWQIFLYINILVYILLIWQTENIARFSSMELQNAGAISYPLIMQGQWWRLITAMFLHGGLIHIIANLTTLYIAGLFLQPYFSAIRYGGVKFILLYLLCGIVAGGASVMWNQETISVGASGAIVGLLGFFILSAIKARRNNPYFKNTTLLVVIIMTGSTIVMGFLIPNIDNAGHIGGLLCGMMVGLLTNPIKGNSVQKHKKSESVAKQYCHNN